MTQSGVYKIILRDDRFDAPLRASDLLLKTLNDIRQKKIANIKANNGGKIPKGQNILAGIDDISRDHVMFVGSTYKPFVSVATEYTKIRPYGDATSYLNNTGGSVRFQFPMYGHFISDMVLHVKVGALGSTTATSPFYRYCALPGLRMFKNIAFYSDETLIDEYTRDEAVAYSKFFVHNDYLPSWQRAVGQQQIKTASCFNPAGYTIMTQYSDGMQTPKLYQPISDMWVPLQFDFCLDAARAIPNDLISASQRIIKIDVAPITDIIFAYNAQRQQIALPVGQVQIDLNLYVNSLFVNPEIHEIIASRIGFSLIRVHRRQTAQTTLSRDDILLNQLKYPIEFMLFGFKDINNSTDPDLWYLMGTSSTQTQESQLYIPIAYWNGFAVQLGTRSSANVTSLDNLIDQGLSLTAQTVEIYKNMPMQFFSNYLPIRYMERALIRAPIDANMGLISECLYPGNFQPSGYFPSSAGRELFLSYSSSLISNSLTAEYQVFACTLNFLVRKGDKVLLRFSV
jgi:hypothetical protein